MSYFETRTRAPRGSFVPSPVFFGIVGLFVLAGLLAWFQKGSDGFNVFLFVLSGWLLSLCLHEYAHALVGYWGGDYGVIHRGYLHLNPFKYVNALLSIVVPLIFIVFGGIALPGGAVLIDHHRLRNKQWDTAVSLAGPAMNLIFAVVLIAPFAIGIDFFSHQVFWSGVAYLAFFQVMAGIFNLLPIPGLDGGNAAYPWLSLDWRRGFDAVRPWGFFLAFAIIYLLRNHVFGWIYDVLNAFGVNSLIVANGQILFQFWR
ncbi:MAG TPA: site-2 protease family protein [Micromonosporaceae bacterium]|nr:site-2 protease family protein [Micromonosporaceae bacterium]